MRISKCGRVLSAGKLDEKKKERKREMVTKRSNDNHHMSILIVLRTIRDGQSKDRTPERTS